MPAHTGLSKAGERDFYNSHVPTGHSFQRKNKQISDFGEVKLLRYKSALQNSLSSTYQLKALNITLIKESRTCGSNFRHADWMILVAC